MTKRDYVIIVGAMKSGTTTLFDILARHPEIAPASDKEPGFFAFDPVWEKGFSWFDTLFEFDPKRHRYRLEASTDYTKAPFVTDVWKRMTTDPDVSVKLIYIMRHPLRRLESHARHVQGARMEIGREITQKADHALDAGLSSINLAISEYAQQLDAYAEAHRAGNLHCLTLEELRDAPDATLAGLFTFLDLDPSAIVPELPVSNAAGNQTREHPAWGYLARMQPVMTVGKALLPPFVRQAIKSRFRQKINPEGRFKLTAQETALLTSLYSKDLEALRNTYGIDTQKYWEL